MNEPQEDPQSKVSKDEVHPQHTSLLQRSDRMCQASLRYNFIIENNNSINCQEMCPEKPIVKLLTVEKPSIVIDLLINKIYLASST